MYIQKTITLTKEELNEIIMEYFKKEGITIKKQINYNLLFKQDPMGGFSTTHEQDVHTITCIVEEESNKM